MTTRHIALNGILLALAASVAVADEIGFPSGERQSIGSSYSLTPLRSSDVDGDGDLDLVTGADYSVSWWENPGDAGMGWIEHVVDGTIHHVTGVAAADLDFDGDPDVLSSVSFEDEIAWHENLGGGAAWAKHTVDTTVDGASSVCAADIDGDGDLDLVATAFDGGTIGWWSNDDGLALSWTAHPIDASVGGARSGLVADIDGDGDLDVGAVAFSDQIASWWENTTGTGSAWTEHVVATGLSGAYSLAAGDIDRDGDIDLAGTVFFADTVWWWSNTDGVGSMWSAHTITTSLVRPRSVQLADVNSDGLLDAVTTGHVSDVVRIHFNGNGGQNWSPHTFDDAFDGAEQVIAADLDNDGDLDVAACSRYGSGLLAWWPNETIHRSALYPEQRGVSSGFTLPWSVDTADFDGDGDPDVVAAASGSDTVAWFENSVFERRDASWEGVIIDSDFDFAAAVRAADLDNDGDPDVVGAALFGDTVRWWENSSGNGSVWTEHVIADGFDGAFAVDVADMDGDGDLDVVGAALTADAVTWWENSDGGGLVWTPHAVEGALDGAVSVAVADLDGDGDPDVAAAASQADSFEWFENLDGAATSWSRHTIATGLDYAHAVAIADLDGDGDPDLVGAAAWSDRLLWWENALGNASAWLQHSIDDSVDGVRGLDVADLDGDGDLDVLAAAAYTAALSWWENSNHGGTAWIEHQLDGAFGGGTAVRAADFTGNGWLDVVATPHDFSSIEWWESLGGQFALATTELAPSFARSGETLPMLDIIASHRGRPGDGAAWIGTFQVQIADGSSGSPLSEAEANALIAELTVWLDDGSGVFEPGSDTLVVTIDQLTFYHDQQQIEFAIGDPNASFGYDSPSSFWVVIELQAGAHQQTPHQLAIKHCTQAEYSSSAWHWDYGVGLELEWVEEAWTQTTVIVDPATIFLDDFESGDATAWSWQVP